MTKQFLILFVLAVGCTVSAEPLKPEDFPDTVVLSRNKIQAVFSASCGLMVGLNYDGNEFLYRNLLPSEKTRVEGEKELRFYGGSRLWCHPAGDETPYAAEVKKKLGGRSWPPDDSLDHGRWSLAEKGKDRLLLKSPRKTKTGLRLEREFHLQENGVDIREKVIREKSGSIPAFVWSIVVIPYPEQILLDNDRPELLYAPISATRNRYVEGAMGGICGSRSFHLIGKKGLWSAAVYARHLIVQYHGGSMAPIVFGNARKRYVELESQSLPVALAEGESLEHTVRIRIFKRPEQGGLRTFVEMIRNNDK